MRAEDIGDLAGRVAAHLGRGGVPFDPGRNTVRAIFICVIVWLALVVALCIGVVPLRLASALWAFLICVMRAFLTCVVLWLAPLAHARVGVVLLQLGVEAGVVQTANRVVAVKKASADIDTVLEDEGGAACKRWNNRAWPSGSPSAS